MSLGLLGKKLGMSQIFDKDGKLIPVTFIEAGPCYVLQKKSKESDGYEAVQVGFGEKKEKSSTKPLLGHFKKAGVPALRFVREFRLEETGNGGDKSAPVPDVGQVIDLDVFQAGDHVDVVGVSKGRGFTSPIKRWHVKRGPESHGSMNVREPGSIGQSAYPSRVIKGTRSSGHMGDARVTVKGLTVAKVDIENNLLMVRGAVPGPNGGLVIVKKS